MPGRLTLYVGVLYIHLEVLALLHDEARQKMSGSSVRILGKHSSTQRCQSRKSGPCREMHQVLVLVRGGMPCSLLQSVVA